MATLSYESWRYKDRPVTKEECQQCSYKWLIPKDCKTFADSIKPLETELLFQHANRKYTVFDYTVSREGLDSIKQQLDNPIGGLVFGGKISMPGFKFAGTSTGVYASTDYMAWNYTTSALRQTTISIDLYTGSDETKPLSSSQSRSRSAKWWHAYWQRSYIISAGDARNMVRNYELFRYMLGCNAYGAYPTKFNGSLFTFDPVYADAKCSFTPDYRRWGGGTMTAQNQRLVYWPMLKSGDADLMKSQFDTYLRMLGNATLRTRFYWGHDGASFTEQIENFGLPNPAEYGKHKSGDDMGTERNAWLEYLWDTSLEFCSMALQANKYCGMNISRYEPLIEQSLLFSMSIISIWQKNKVLSRLMVTENWFYIHLQAARLTKWPITQLMLLQPCRLWYGSGRNTKERNAAWKDVSQKYHCAPLTVIPVLLQPSCGAGFRMLKHLNYIPFFLGAYTEWGANGSISHETRISKTHMP